MEHLVHWDNVGKPLRRRRQLGHLTGWWTDLGTAAGSITAGVERIEIDPGRWSTPAHAEQAEEEIFYVFDGSGLAWQDGEVYELGPDDCLVHLAGKEAHTLRAGDEGLDVLAFGTRRLAASTRLPRAGVSWLGDSWVDSGQGESPWQREVAAGEPEIGKSSLRPDRIVNVTAVEARPWGKGERIGAERRDLGRAAGSCFTGLKHVTVSPGKWGVVPHCHSSEEEIFVVLDGEGVFEIGDEEAPVRRGHVIARPAGTEKAHSFRAGRDGLVLLAYGTREANDITYYPRSNKIFFRGLGLIGRFEPLDYWDGRPEIR